METSLSYLLRRTAVNHLKNLKNKPSRLILLIAILVILGLTLFQSLFQTVDLASLRPRQELEAIVFGVYGLIFGLSINQGIKSGGAMFRMSDVNFLFPSPLPKRSILIYAMTKSLGSSLFIGVFILFQYSNLRMQYGISMVDMLIIFLGYSLSAYLTTALFMLIYTYVSDDDRKKSIAIWICYGVLAIGPIYAFILYFNSQNLIAALVAAGSSPLVQWVPIFGWLAAVVKYLLLGQYLLAAVWLLVCAAFLGLVFWFMTRSNREYYEDVIVAAQNMDQMKAQAASGTRIEKAKFNAKHRGIGGGKGAIALFYKHMLEKKRTGTLGFRKTSLIFMVVLIGMAFFMKRTGNFQFLFGMSVYFMLIDFITSVRLSQELDLPYIYLVPENPSKKLFFSILNEFPNTIIESVFIMIGCGLLFQAEPILIGMAIIARVGFASVYIGSHILIRRVFGGMNKTMSGLVQMLASFILIIPLVVVGIIVGINLGMALAYLGMGIVGMIEMGVILFACRNMLNYSEINQ